MRSAGVLMPITSLPSPWGIGTLGRSAREFLDFLAESGQTYWQLLTLDLLAMATLHTNLFPPMQGTPI